MTRITRVLRPRRHEEHEDSRRTLVQKSFVSCTFVIFVSSWLKRDRTVTMERLRKILSQAGIASRRASEKLMLDGRVTVNGATVTELGTKADASRDDIRVDGRRVKSNERRRYLLLNKPRGYVTTRSDPQERPT